MKATEINFEFPLLGIGSDNDLWGFSDLRQLTTCGPRTIKEDMQIGLELIDCGGQRWRVKQLRQIGRDGSLPIWWLKSLVSTPQFRVEQELQPLDPLNLNQTIDRVCAAMRAHPEFWCDDYEGGPELDARIAEVRSAVSISAIHEVLGLDTFEAY